MPAGPPPLMSISYTVHRPSDMSISTDITFDGDRFKVNRWPADVVLRGTLTNGQTVEALYSFKVRREWNKGPPRMEGVIP